ncbi:BQ5605_C012g06866 [Microbotryum silenes-dioicae]|uniref:BQ5605_C012g06866 protein n=1 Tax=Microbotryum silenes-dioicae TaxID=796604 RepID=A0A2X0NPS4_9BASI|nr:BQ5605_C012g06866 [Microbotryum silenes-dioicae]
MHPLPPAVYHRPKAPNTPQPAASSTSKSGTMLSSARNSTLFSPSRRGKMTADGHSQASPASQANDSASKSWGSSSTRANPTTSSLNLAHMLGLGQQRDSITLPRKQHSSGSQPHTLSRADERELGGASLVEAGASFEHSTSGLGQRAINAPSGASDRSWNNEEPPTMKKKGWFEEVYVKGALTPQKYCAVEHDEAAYWPGYSLQVRDKEMFLNAILTSGQGSIEGTWAHTPKPPNSMTGATRPTLPPPKRALDLGCGPLSIWSVSTATIPGWEATEFVGLDIVPSQLPLQYLPSDIADRLTYVQHNYFTPLPFEDGEFDFVRLCDLGANMPEHQWDFVIEEATRVLAIVDRSFRVLGKHIEGASSSSDPDYSVKLDPFARVQACIDGVFDHRFVNPYNIRIIPTSVCLHLHDVQSTGVLTIEVPFERPLPGYSPAETPSIQASNNVDDEEKTPIIEAFASCPPLYDFSSIHLGKTTKMQAPYLDSIVMAIEADRLTACSFRLAHEGALVEMREEDRREGPRPKSASEALRFAKLRSELVDTIHAHCAGLRQHADLARIFSDQSIGWGWTCKMDEEALALQLSNQPLLEERIAECVRMLDLAVRREASQGMTRDDVEAGLDTATMEMRLAHARFAKREAEQEVRALESRLGIDKHKEVLKPGELGTATVCCWVATKKAPVAMRT